jgi:RND family efflux transporter MFP subunit
MKMPDRDFQTKKIWIQIIFVFLILTFGIIAAVLLISSRKPPKRQERKVFAPLVNVETIHKQDIGMVIRGYGTVKAKNQVQLIPQVSGRIIALHPNFASGGFFRAGETLITIDPRDYELAVQRTRAVVARAQVKLDLEKAEASVARQEWEQLNPGQEPTSTLVIREPQIRQAQAELEAAKAELSTARLNLERTKVSLPFDGRIAEENVDMGQYVPGGQPVASVYGISAVEIPVPIEDHELAWFEIPSRASVQADFAGGIHKWDGKVVRTDGQIDPKTRLVTVIVEVTGPFKKADGRPHLVPGMFVEATIQGKVLEQVIPIPRSSIHKGAEVWVVQDDSRLRIHEIEIARLDRDFAYVISGLDDGTMIVTSPLDTVTDGMKIRTQKK